MANAGKIIIVTAPSGAGKTSITHYLLKECAGITFSVSATTREPRANEKNGIDYYFISVEEFQQKIKEDAFVEWEMVYEGKYYGTLKSELQKIWQAGKTPMLDIDVHGAIHVQKQHPENSLSVFIEPPSIEALEKRLESRGTDTKENVQTRINKAGYEMSFKHSFNVVIINDDLHRACLETQKLVLDFLGKDAC